MKYITLVLFIFGLTYNYADTQVHYHALSVKLPGSWQQKSQGQELHVSSPQAAMVFSPPLAKNNQDLGDYVKNLVLRQEKAKNMTLLKSPYPQPVVFPQQQGAIWMRIVKLPNGQTVCIGTVTFNIGDQYQTLQYLTGSMQTFTQLSKTLDAIEIAPWKTHTTKPIHSANTVSKCFYTLRIPTNWGKYTSRVANLVEADLQHSNYNYKTPVKIGMYIGSPRMGKKALSNWLISNFYPEKKYHTKVYSELDWTTAQRQNGYATVVSVTQNGRFVANLLGHLVIKDGCSLFAGIAMDFKGLSKKMYTPARLHFEWFAYGELRNVLMNIQLNIPSKQSRWKTLLIDKSTYRYRYEYSYVDTLNGFSAHKEHNISWDFYGNGTCKKKTKGFVGYLQNSDSVSGLGGGVGTFERSKTFPPTSFEVLGTSSDLWITVYHSDGLATIHSVEPNKKGTYGPFTFQGLCIEGEVEGKYATNGDYKTYKPFK